VSDAELAVKMGTRSEQDAKVYRLLVENSLGLMCVHDMDGTLLSINPAAAESLGYPAEELCGRSIRDLLAPSVRHLFEEYLRRIRSNSKDSGIMRLQSRDGAERLWLYRNVLYREAGAPMRVLGHAQDVTERIKAERELRQSQAELARARDELELRVAERTVELQKTNERLQSEVEQRERVEEELLRTRKLEAIGRLAGGLAHDFNNLMTIVIGYCESLGSELAGNQNQLSEVSQIRKAAERANSLTRQLLAFSRRQKPQAAFLSLNTVLTEMADMLRRLLSDDIEVEILPDSSLGLIRVDRGQLEQVILNLVINAADAMPRGGRLVLATANVLLNDDCCDQLLSQHDSKSFVRLTVSDTGVGMSAEIKARIFDPFFTTKEQGKGTGLGLATVYGIVQQAGGHISVDSEPGQGTSFNILFPRTESGFESNVQAETSFQSMRGSETVLLVDDQDDLRSLLCEVLRKNGYSVVPANNGKEALRLMHEHAGPIDLVITDLLMPQMGGRELAEALRALHPHTKIVYMSGYAEQAEDVPEPVVPRYSLIEKPFTPETLLRKIRDALS
jgi:two-component system, cell cycle sensor histidine kinase and response regulator CckA